MHKQKKNGEGLFYEASVSVHVHVMMAYMDTVTEFSIHPFTHKLHNFKISSHMQMLLTTCYMIHSYIQGHKESTLNSLCMTESLFPSSKHSKQHQPPQPLPPPPAKKQKTYSIDDILNAPIHSVESMHAQNKQSKSSLDLDHRIDYGGEFVAPRKKEAVRKRKEVYASNGESILTAMHGVHEKPGVYSKVCN